LLLPIESLRKDGGTQPRASIDIEVAYQYGDEMALGAKFPPVVAFYDGSDYWLADGFHRVEGADSAGIDKIECDVRQGTCEDAQWYSFGVNKAHGLRRTNEDKQRAVKAALKHPRGASLTDEVIAVHVGVDAKTVAIHRSTLVARLEIPDVTVREGRDGKKYDTSKQGKRSALPVALPAVAPTPPATGPRICAPVSRMDEPEPEPEEVATAVTPAPPVTDTAARDLAIAISHVWAILERGSTPAEMGPYLLPEHRDALSDLRLWAEAMESQFGGLR
jgi:hypothetical protein